LATGRAIRASRLADIGSTRDRPSEPKASSRAYRSTGGRADAPARGGVPLRVVQALLGHSTIQATMRYAHLSPDSKGRAVVNVLDAATTTTAAAEFAQHRP
jgi:integrase